MRVFSPPLSRFLAIGVIVASASLAACRDTPVDAAPDHSASSSLTPREGGALPTVPELPEFIQAVKIDLPPNPATYELDDAELVAAVRASGGQVHIGFKPAAAGRTLQTGMIPGLTRAQALEGRRAVEAAGGKIFQTYRNSATIAAVIPPEAAPALRKLPTVNFVEALAPYTIFHEYPAEQRSWGVDKVRAPEVWNAGVIGDAAWISILDTGFDQHHFDERFNGGDANIGNFVCWSISSVSSSCWDSNGHGSHVTGIANAAPNGVGVVGISQPVGYAALKVCATSSCNESAIAAALDWTTSSGKPRHIVNMSLGGPYHLGIAEAAARSYNAGNLLVAAAGNTPQHTSVQYPAALSQVIAVSGTLEDDSFASSHYCARTKAPPYTSGSVSGSAVELSAPYWARSLWLHLEYEVLCGTSMASPVVAGVAALVWTRNPTWSNVQVRQRLQQTAVDLGPAGRDAQFGYGRVDALRAVYMLSASISGPTYISSSSQYTWEAMPDGGDGSYTYQWQVQWENSGYTQTLGNAKTESLYVSPGDGNFTLSVTVSSGGQTVTSYHYVQTSGSGTGECGIQVIC